MKIIITESQYIDLMLKRRWGIISDLMRNNLGYYPPCDYQYPDGFHDYYGDLRNYVISTIIEDLKWNWSDESTDEFYEKLNTIIFEPFYDEAKEYFDYVISDGCDEN